MTNTKMTIAQGFEQVIEILTTVKANPELVEFMQERLEKHNARKTGKTKGLTKVQKENLVYIEKIQDFFENQADKEIAYTSVEIAQALEFDFTPQKMTALLKQVQGIHKVAKATNDNKKVGYQLGEPQEDEKGE